MFVFKIKSSSSKRLMARLNFNNHGMEYNTEKSDLLFPEYGRNIQAMIVFAKDEKDMTKRQLMVEAIVSLMYQMNPQSKNVDDYKEKLWKHVFHIGGYNLGGVLPPSGIHPVPEDNIKKPEPLGYPASGARFRHYGNNVHKLIKKAQAMEDGHVKEGMVGTIGAYMKLAYRTWNKDNYVSDEIIKSDLDTLSNGTLELDEGQRIDRLAAANKRRRSDDNNGRNNDNRGGGTGARGGSNMRSNDNRNDRNNDNRGGGTGTRGGSNMRSNDNRNDRNNDNRGGGTGTRGGSNMRNNDNRNDRNNDNRGGRR
jgi:hypothetical protein